MAAPAAPKGVSLCLVQPDAGEVFVAGCFNDWQPAQTPLKPAGQGKWVVELPLAPGRYEYLFVVDGTWIPDPNATESVPNPFGGKNSVLVAGK